MRDDTPSRTAQWVAAARGMGTLLPEDMRLADDPYGVAFSSPALARVLDRNRPGLVAKLPGFKTWIVYMQVRTRLLDDAVRDFVEAGGAQVVLLGAGFDTRALRLPELDGVRVFEVDHPATQRHKRATLERLGAESPAIYVTWDFETRPMEDLPDALAEAGHDPAAPTLTIWEGVTMYLTDGAIDASVRCVASYSAPGSQLAMTYFAVEDKQPSTATRFVRSVVARIGEPWRFGWRPHELADYLAERGWQLARDVTMPEAAQQLLPPDLARVLDAASHSHVAISRR